MDIDPKIIKRTQETLGKIIRKPTLTDKLLSRPPFRFLHDIITAFIRTTGLMKGLFTPDELVADNVKEKENKLTFLQKVVDYLSVVHDTTIPVRIMSIIAGKEPEKTNELLVYLADTVNKNVNNDECVARALHGGGRAGGARKTKSRSPESLTSAKSRVEKSGQPQGNKTADKETPQRKEEPDEGKAARRYKKSEKEKHDDRTKKHMARQKSVENELEQTNGDKITPDRKDRDKNESGRQSRIGPDRQSRVNSRCESIGKEKIHDDDTAKPVSGLSESPVQPAKLVRPPSAKGNRVRKEGILI
ncbi:unnamed protein product [Echinostoma caproni]|uniref:TRAF3-interacting protein 1 n=1 Tax=Echinostoma caproni TaxID=27848 RepID=A0A183AVV5_9TREM|nr:unnamed protein product [Echinostoma caproni]